MFDSESQMLFQTEVEMPTDIERYKKRFIESDDKDLGFICFAIENNEGRHVGLANLFGVNERHGTFGSVGIFIDVGEQGKGYGTAAYRILGNYMFKERRLHKWNSDYIEGNTGSAALHKKIGFEIEGVSKDMYCINGKYWSSVMLGITAEQFFKNNN